jgi:hypothetical protein
LYEYQNKGFAKFAIRKSLILKGWILVVWGWQRPKMAALEKKSGSKLPLYMHFYTEFSIPRNKE